MRALKYLLIAVAILIFAPSYALPADLGAMYTTLIERDVYIYDDDSGEWQAIRANYPLWAGDSLWAAEGSRAEIGLLGDTYVRMDGGTLLEVPEIEDSYVRLFMDEGRLYINNERGTYDHIQADSGYASVRAEKGSIVMFDAAKSGAASVSVLKGYATVQSSSGSVRVNAGSMAHVGYDLYADITPLGSADEWERWNRGRDDLIKGVYASTRYLPEELHVYAYDFDTYGSWVYLRDYGYCWRPTLSVSLSLGWAPYKHGRWRWRHGYYVWISDEPWGWGPYHYGRWTHIGSLGWCWVPPTHGAVYWAPGYVGWVYTSDYVAWVPLAPHEIYYGYGYYGPYSVNIIDIDIHKTVIKNVYVNKRYKNAVTAEHRGAFLTGRERRVKAPKNLFEKGRRGLGPPPDFRPSREGRAVPRNMEVYKPRERRERAGPERRAPETRPSPPGREERRAPELRERPSPPGREERRAPELRERPTPPGREERRAPELRERPTPPGREERRAPEIRERPTPPGREERRAPEIRERPSPPGREERRAPEIRERPSPPGREERRAPEIRERPSPPGREERRAPEIRERPSAPGREMERRAPEERERPGVQGPPERRERTEPPGRGLEPERGRERTITPSRPSEPERGRERTITPSRPSEPERGRERAITPPVPREPERGRELTITPARPSEPGGGRKLTITSPTGSAPKRMETLSPPGSTREGPRPATVVPERRSTPSAPPARPAETSRPSRPSKPSKASKPSKPEVKTSPTEEEDIEMPGGFERERGRGREKSRGRK